MSLINDALKKAQHQRKDEPAAATGAAGEARIHRRGRAPNANTMVLLGSAAIVLVVLTVVFTFYLVNQPSKPAAPVAKVAPAPAPTPPAPAPSLTSSPTPVVAPAPAPTPVAPTVSVPLATAPAGQGSAPLAPVLPTVAASTAPAVTAPAVPGPATSRPPPATTAPAATGAAAAAPGPDERVASFVESVRVTGIRSFGNESRVLMNERVFRVNDVVDRLLGVKLTAVSADSLTFTDANGVTYVKNF